MTSENVFRVTWRNETASGKRTGWAKTVVDVAVGSGVRGAKAFMGEYLRNQEYDLPYGTVILEVHPVGSVKNGHEEARLWVVDKEEGLKRFPGEWDWHKQFLTVKDQVHILVQKVRAATSEEPLKVELDPSLEQQLAEGYEALVKAMVQMFQSAPLPAQEAFLDAIGAQRGAPQ